MSRSFDLSQLPALPEGWCYEPHAFDSDVIHIVWLDHGVVSLHFRRRIIEYGWCIPYQQSGFRDAGRGWKDRLVRAAIARLQASASAERGAKNALK